MYQPFEMQEKTCHWLAFDTSPEQKQGNGTQVTTDIWRTAEKPGEIKLLTDYPGIIASGSDISFITVELVDQHQIRNTLAQHEIQFSIEKQYL